MITAIRSFLILSFAFCISKKTSGQVSGSLPPFTKWYQDPLGTKPLELSSAFGFLWGAAGVAACLAFANEDVNFQKKTLVYHEAGANWGYKFPYTSVFHTETGFMYEIKKRMSLGIEWNIFRFNDEINNTWGLGFRPFARWYAFKGEKVAVFFEYGAGISYCLKKFPLTGTGWEADTGRVGTQFNFTSKYGTGAEIRLNDRIKLQTGIRHFHLSNGNLAGIKRNPSHDSNGFFIGILYNYNKKNAGN